MKLSSFFTSEFSDHALFESFKVWMEKVSPQIDSVVMHMWRAYLAGFKAHKELLASAAKGDDDEKESQVGGNQQA